MKKIKYIGDKAMVTCFAGQFARGQATPVPEEVYARLIKDRDEWADGEEGPIPKKKGGETE